MVGALVTTSADEDEDVKLNASVARVAATSLDPNCTDEGDSGGGSSGGGDLGSTPDEGVCSAELGLSAKIRVLFSVLGCEAFSVGWVVVVVASGDVFSELLASSDVAVGTEGGPFTGLLVALSSGMFRPDVLMTVLKFSCASPADDATGKLLSVERVIIPISTSTSTDSGCCALW